MRDEVPTSELGYRRSFRKDFKPENHWEDGEERSYLEPSSLEVRFQDYTDIDWY